jgi:hypothetical protein
MLTFGYAKLSKDALNILDVNEYTNESIRVYLANVKAPILGKPFAFEAK